MVRTTVSLILCIFLFASTAAIAQDDIEQGIIDDGVKNCLENPELVLEPMVNPEMRAQVEGRRFPAFCTCYANTFFRLIFDSDIALKGGTVRNDPEYTKRIAVMTNDEMALVTYRRCVNLVVQKIP